MAKKKSCYRVGIVGARRGLYHAAAYKGIANMKVVALCEIDAERLAAGVKQLGVPGYLELDEMLEKEHLDVVHAVTRPFIPRAKWIKPCAEAGVQALVIEKPIALIPSEFNTLTRTADAHPSLKIIVNTQRRYMPFAVLYRKLIAGKKMSLPHFVRGNVRGSVLDMSPHLLDCILLLMGDSRPTAVWAAAEGARNFACPNERGPDNLIAEFTFASGARVFFESTQESLGTANFPLPEKFDDWQPERCNLDVWATEGRFWWREYGTWGYQLNGMRNAKVERTHFFRDDISAQHLFTKAIGEWLDDRRKPHHNRFELSRVHMDCLYGAYKSALEGRRLNFPIRVKDSDVTALKRKLSLAEKK